LHPLNGSLAQLVQSICLTSRGSGVRTPQLPQKKRVYRESLDPFFVEMVPFPVFRMMFRNTLALSLFLTTCLIGQAQNFSVELQNRLSRPVMRSDTSPGTRCLPPRVHLVSTGDSDHYLVHFRLELTVIFIDKDSTAIRMQVCTYPKHKATIISLMKRCPIGDLFSETFSGFENILEGRTGLNDIYPLSFCIPDGSSTQRYTSAFCYQGLEKIAAYIQSVSRKEIALYGIKKVRFDFRLEPDLFETLTE
jgi:hypothetical protein